MTAINSGAECVDRIIADLTCGVGPSADPISGNLTPQETTNEDSPDMGRDGASLSCSGSSEVAT